MLHLPGLVLSELINQVIQAVSKIGLAVRGLYGEGTEAMGNLFQISNQTTLGEKEDGKIIHGANSTADDADETDGSSREDRFALTQRTLQQIGANETRADKR